MTLHCLAPLLACLLLQGAPAQPQAPAGQRQGPQEIPGPIRADPATVNFGIVEPGTVVSATIKLNNPLDTPVTIKAAKPSCTCTTVDMTGKVIPARGSIEMPMSMKTSHSVGLKVAQVNLVFEGLNQLMSVRLEAETAYAVRANPAYVDALAPERMAGFFEVMSTDGQPFTVKTVDGKPAVTADGLPMKPAALQVVKYDLSSSGLHRAVPPFLIVETDHPKCPVLDLRVRHATTRIAPLLNLAEFRSNVGVLQNGTPAEFEIEVKHAREMRLSGVRTSRAEVEASILEQKSDGDSLLVKIRLLPKSMPIGPFLFTCTLEAPGKNSDLWLYGTTR